MEVLKSVLDLERHAFAARGYPECYRAVDLAPFFGTTVEKISRVRSAKKARFPADFYIGSGIYTRKGVLALAMCLRTNKAAEVSCELLDTMFGGVH